MGVIPKGANKRRTVSSLKKGGGTVVTYETLFSFVEMLFIVIGTFISAITLIVLLIKLNNPKGKDKRKK